MPINLIIDSLDAVEEGLRGEYVQQPDGKYKLNVLGLDDTTNLKKNNQALLAEKKALQEKLKSFDGLDPEQVKAAMDRISELEEVERKLKEKKLMEEGKVEELIQARLSNMKNEHDSQVKTLNGNVTALTEENGLLRTRLSREVIMNGLTKAVNAVGQPRTEALVDILNRGQMVFQLDEKGNPVPKDSQGVIVFGANGNDPMTMEEWAAGLLKSAPHLFLESKGGGAKGSATDASGRKYSAEELAGMTPEQKMNIGRNAAKR